MSYRTLPQTLWRINAVLDDPRPRCALPDCWADALTWLSPYCTWNHERQDAGRRHAAALLTAANLTDAQADRLAGLLGMVRGERRDRAGHLKHGCNPAPLIASTGDATYIATALERAPAEVARLTDELDQAASPWSDLDFLDAAIAQQRAIGAAWQAAWYQIGAEAAELLVRPRPPWWRRVINTIRSVS